MKSLRIWLVLYICIVFGVAAQPIVLADPLRSTNFQFQETSLGGNGLFNSSSSNFQGVGSGAVLGIGNSASSNFSVNAGHLTTGDPSLAFAVNTPTVSFGTFSASAATVATATFEVINYTSYGYVVQVLGTEPTYNSHTIDAMSSTGPSQVGIEQYGINVVANTSPVSVGANPDNGQFGYGAASANYGTPNNYRFVSGETIAAAPKSSGQTIYTVTYLVNVSSLTPGGQYSAGQTLIVTGTY